MKRFLTFFLFQPRPEAGWSVKRRVGFWTWNLGWLLAAAAGLASVSLLLAVGHYGLDLGRGYFERPIILLLNLLPCVGLMFLMYGLTGRASWAFAVTAAAVLGFSVGNYYKLVFRDDPLMFADLFLLKEAGNMVGSYRLFLDKKLALALVCAVGGWVFLHFLVRGKLVGRERAITAVLSVLVMAALAPAYLDAGMYNIRTAYYERLDNRWSSTQQYIARGFVYPFLHSITETLPNPPEGYSERETAALLARYENADIPEDKKVNIVGIMLEAFADFSIYEQIEYQQDVYAIYHALEAEGYSGTLLDNIFAGGTVDTERAFLTGMAPGNLNYRSNTSSYAWYLKSQGYRTSGDHPCYAWFYNRRNVNGYLGFDSYRFVENYYTQFTNNNVAPDRVFMPELTASVMEQLEDEAPLFSFSVSYQGHGPYNDDICWWGEVDDYIANHDLDQGTRTILANYFGSVMDTQRYLAEMADAFRASGEPIVLVVFGDHKPWLGNGNSVYNALGIDLSGGDRESFYNYWSTRYLIWANDAAREVIGRDIAGVGPDISPCFLMNVLFERLGWKGDAYMQAVDECRREAPVIHNGNMYITADGELKTFSELTQEQAALVRRFRDLEYYRLRHYSA